MARRRAQLGTMSACVSACAPEEAADELVLADAALAAMVLAPPPPPGEVEAPSVLADAALAAMVLAPPPPPGEVEAPSVDSFASESEQGEQQEQLRVTGRPPAQPRPSRRKALARLGLSEEDAGKCASSPTGYETEEQLQRRKALRRLGTTEEELLIVAADKAHESERARRPSQARSMFASMRDRRDRRGQRGKHDQPDQHDQKPTTPRRSTSQLCMLALRGGVFV